MPKLNIGTMNIYGTEAPQRALEQMAELCHQNIGLPITVSPDGRSFVDTASPPPNSGILALRGELHDEEVMSIHFKLVDRTPGVRVQAMDLISHLAALDQKLDIADRLPGESEASGLWIKVLSKASPMSVTRMGPFLDHLKRIESLARLLQSEMPALKSHEGLVKRYEEFKGLLKPIFPADQGFAAGDSSLSIWVDDTIAFLTSARLVAIAGSTETAIDCATALLARSAGQMNLTLGQVHCTSLNSKVILELAGKAPGVLVLPAVQISLAANPYELSSEMQSTLSLLRNYPAPVLFTGTIEELQNTFAGGQGARHDPLVPVVRHIPEIPEKILLEHILMMLGIQKGGLPEKTLSLLRGHAKSNLKALRSGERRRILPLVAHRVLNDWESGRLEDEPGRQAFISRAQQATETLGGIAVQARAQRAAHIQDSYTRKLTDPGLIDFLSANLLAQDRALRQLADRLRMEVLTRPATQPIRLWSQGTPSTGKSESCVLLARHLNIPYVNIDAGSFPNYHTAYSQLLGAARSYVGSHKAGRLEQVAKHHCGCLVELSDIDHAPLEVRVFIGDLLLQLLETGEGQSAMGAMFNCTNLIIVFTMNLPDGMDESVRKHLGFGKAPSFEEVRNNVIAEVKKILSGALLSRLGSPILFEPLRGDALARILETAVEKAVRSAMRRMEVEVGVIALAEGLGKLLLDRMHSNVTTFGARALLEHGRHQASRAVLAGIPKEGVSGRIDLRLVVNSGGELEMEIVSKNKMPVKE